MPPLSLHLESAIDAIVSLTSPGPLIDGLGTVGHPYGLDASEDTSAYQLWLDATATARREASRAIASELTAAGDAPRISVVVPVYCPDRDLLDRCARSVLEQSYERWQLCLCDDASDDDGATAAALDALRVLDPRIAVARLGTNGGISVASNAAAALATGSFIAFLDQDDELEPGVLGDVAAAIVADREADVLYTDQDKLDLDGRSEPYFKPGFSPDLLLSNMYMAHLLVIRRELFERLGGLRPEFDGSQDYDLALRATEAARKVVHIPVIGYHWRRTAGSTALSYDAKPAADDAARRALADAMVRRGEPATIESGLRSGTFRVRRAIPTPAPKVSVIVPFHDGATLLRRCVDSVAIGGHGNVEIVLVDNRSWQPETRALVTLLEALDNTRVLTFDQPFNWSAINNWAAKRASGDLLLFMNSDVEGRSEGWLSAMVEHASRPEVGAVGARLLYPDGSIQHAGVVLGLGGVAWHAFCYCPSSKDGYFGHARLTRNYSAVTGACMMTRREVFEASGGFDAAMAVAYNDIDFCLRLRERGYLVVYTPYAELCHYEGASRGRSAVELEEAREMIRKWQAVIQADPYFNPNLSARRSEFQVRPTSEERSPWEDLV